MQRLCIRKSRLGVIQLIAIALLAFFITLFLSFHLLRVNAVDWGSLTLVNQCRQLDHLSPDEHQTVEALLAIAETQECQLATNRLLSMTELDLSDRQLSSLTALTGLTQLQVLYLNQNQVTDLSPLQSLTNLTALYLPDNQVVDISRISRLEKLTTLYLDNNRIQDLSSLSNLRSLTILYANNNQIKTLDGVSNLTRLTELYLANNYITDLRPLRSLSDLTRLNLGSNQITDINSLATLNQLIQLDLDSNQISRLEPLSSLEQLISLDLRDNPLLRKTCPVYPATICVFTDDAADVYRQGEQSLDRGDLNTALTTFQTALSIYQANGDRLRESDALDRIGNVYDELGQYANALDYYQQGGQVRKEVGDRQGESDTLTYLGITYIRIGQTQKALDTLQQARDIYQNLAIEDRSWLRPEPREGIILSSLALAYSQLGEKLQALRFAKLSLASYRRGSDHRGEAIALNRVGEAYLNIGDLDKARLYLKKALDLTQQLDDRAGISRSLHNLGTLLIQLGESSAALDYYQQALDLRQQLGDIAGQGETLNARGKLLLQAGKIAEASHALLSTIELWESLRPGLTDENKISIAETQSQTYRLLQQALVELGDYETALEISERGRARAFVELLAHRLSLRGQSAPPEQVQPPAIAQIQQIASDQAVTLIEYSLVDQELYTWVVESTKTIHFRRQSLNGISLSNQIDATRLAMGIPGRGATIQVVDTSSSTATREALHSLHQLLIQPIADVLPTDINAPIIIIPQGDLFLVPFSVLLDENDTALLEQHPLLFAPTIGFLAIPALQRDSLNIGTDPALVVGNPIMPTDPETRSLLPPLLGAEQEAQDIASLLNTRPLTGAAATKAVVVSQLSDVAIAHFATHGLLDDFGTDIPGALALSPTANDSGFLTAAEIFTIPMNAKLVVLSACDTGRGKITGDGVVGLSRSFLSAGVESVIVSLWSVPDTPTALLMTEFYRQLREYPNRAIALRQAMLKTRQRYPLEAHWGAFTLFGGMGGERSPEATGKKNG